MKVRLTFCLLIISLILFSVSLSEAQIAYALDGRIGNNVLQGNVFRRLGLQSPLQDPAAPQISRYAAFANNEQLPLGGLFAPDFDLTVSAFGGWNRITGMDDIVGGGDAFDDDFAVGFAYGRRHSNKLRSEFEFTYRSNDQETLGSVDVYSIMKNFIVDIQIPRPFLTPYVGIGIGYANVDSEFNPSSGVTFENSSAFAWQPIAGASLLLRERLSCYVEYRYFSTTDLEASIGGVELEDVTYNAHNIFMGLRAEF